MKKAVLILTVAIILVMSVGCVPKIKIPDFAGKEAETVKAAIEEKELIAKLEYEFSNEYRKGLVTRTSPAADAVVEKEAEITIYVSKGPSVTIPDLAGVDETSAVASVSGKKLLPIVEYEYSDDYQKGNVIRTKPAAGSVVEEDTRVTIYVSKGPSIIVATDGTVGWYSVDSKKEDDWDLNYIKIEKEYLYIYCAITPGVSFKIRNFSNVQTSSYSDSIPANLVTYFAQTQLDDNTEVKSGETFYFSFKIPMNRLNSERPTHIETKTKITYKGKTDTLYAEFDIVW